MTKLRWTADDRIIFLADARGESFLCWVPATGGEVRRIAGGGAQATAVTLDAQARGAVVLSVPPSSAGDLYWIDVESGSQRQLTRYNCEYFQEYPPATLQKFSLSRGGMEIESRVFLPPEFDESKRYPMVLEIHG